MAKGLSYGPQTQLIEGAAKMGEIEREATNIGISSFTKGLTESFKAVQEEKLKSKALIDKFASEVKTPENINLLNEKTKSQVLTFTREVRGKVVDLMKEYRRTGNQDLLDEAEIEKSKLVNLKSQIDGYNKEARLYIAADGKGFVPRGQNFDYKTYDEMYSQQALLNISNNGDLLFTGSDAQQYTWKETSGKWNVNNANYTQGFTTLLAAVMKNTKQGGDFDDITIMNSLQTSLLNQGPEEQQVAFETNLIGDDKFVIGYEDENKTKPIQAGTMTFERIWGMGKMDPKYYKGFEAEENGTYDTKWMFDDVNAPEGVRLLSMYNTDVLKDLHEENYVEKTLNTPGRTSKNWLKDKTGIYVGGGNRYIGYNTIKRMYDSLNESKSGKDTKFMLANSIFKYDKKTKKWYSESLPDSGVPTATLLFDGGIGITDPSFEIFRQ